MIQTGSRNRALKSALAAMVLATALLVSPRFTRDAYAYFSCSSNCKFGSCSAQPDPGERCTCTCSITDLPTCTCVHALRENVPG